MSEFGRTPQINYLYGRDHWGTAWSVCLAGAGIKPGNVVGKTNANGTEVVDKQVGGGHLFHTYLRRRRPRPDRIVRGRRPRRSSSPTQAAIGDQGTAGLNAIDRSQNRGPPHDPPQPEKTHVAKELKYGKPLISCRFDPTGRFVFAGAEDDTVQRWDLAADPAKAKPVAFNAHDGWVVRPGASRTTARRSSPAAPTAS